jgi:phospholipid-binding lipoprotein MlaA
MGGDMLRGALVVTRRVSVLGSAALAVCLLASFAAAAEQGKRLPVDDWLFEDEAAEPADADPLEPGNRVVFGFNELLNRSLLDPVSQVYSFVVPDVGRRAVRRFFLNLSEPGAFVNTLMQRRLRDAGATGARFLINSTVGVAGVLDPATPWGFERRHADFGQTLFSYGVGSGPYLVVPLLGPSTARGTIGRIFDGLLRVDLWLLTPASQVIIVAGNGVSGYAAHREQMKELRRSSVDFYAVLRSAYLMDREALLRGAHDDSQMGMATAHPILSVRVGPRSSRQ